jgi:hypothetical protein
VVVNDKEQQCKNGNDGNSFCNKEDPGCTEPLFLLQRVSVAGAENITDCSSKRSNKRK